MDPVPFLVSLAIGALVGLEREQNPGPTFAGTRTMPLVALLGTATMTFVPALLPWAFAAVAGVALLAYRAKVRARQKLGTTTSILVLLVFVLGAMTAHSADAMRFAIVIGAGTTVLLAFKGPLHAFADHIVQEERYAMAKFLLLSLVVLPLLPDREVDLLLGLNPRFVWLMVVFISAIDLVGYLVARYWGARGGMGVAGVLGGLVSSTATTVSLAGRSRDTPELGRVAAYAAFAATLVSLPRVVVEVAVLNRDLVLPVVVPVGAMLAAGAAVLAWNLYRRTDRIPSTPLRNPFRLRPALVFGAFFALILLLSDWMAGRFGESGVYGTALLSGLADVDAVTLSLSRLAAEGSIPQAVAARGIVLAVLSNLAVKVGIAFTLGARAFGIRFAWGAAVVGAVGLATVWMV